MALSIFWTTQARSGRLELLTSMIFQKFQTFSFYEPSQFENTCLFAGHKWNGTNRRRSHYLFLGLVMSSLWHWLNCISVCLSLSFNLLIVSLSFKSSLISATCLSYKIWATKIYLHCIYLEISYSAFTETGATQTMRSNQKAELKQ